MNDETRETGETPAAMLERILPTPKQPRVMKQPTKDELRRQLAEACAELDAFRARSVSDIRITKGVAKYPQAQSPAPSWWRRLFNLTRKTQ